METYPKIGNAAVIFMKKTDVRITKSAGFLMRWVVAAASS
jgi:hypothetical protein